MSLIAFDQRPETIRGHAAELAVSAWLQSLGWYVLPAYDYAGERRDKAPALISLTEGLIAPDLLVAKEGRTDWFEVKRKSHASRGWTGIPLRHFRHYRRVREVTGANVWLVFVHDEEDDVRIGEVEELEGMECPHPDMRNGGRTLRIYEGPAMSYGGMAFFCWECLRSVGHTSQLLAQGQP